MGVKLTVVEKAEITGMGVDLTGYRWARRRGCAHAELVEITALGGDLYVYRWVRDAGASHGECVEIAGMGVDLDGYWWALDAGFTHGELVEVVAVHGLPPGLLDGFLTRMTVTPDADVATVVFETVAG